MNCSLEMLLQNVISVFFYYLICNIHSKKASIYTYNPIEYGGFCSSIIFSDYPLAVD